MGTLSIVATPIGNLEDITLRALRVLKECDVIYAEDTRVISKLLARYEIKKPLQRLDAATEDTKAKEIIDRLEAGEKVAFVSDAGTPGISDPGARLVARVREFAPETKIEAIPGASALAAAISIAGLGSDEFVFLGFLPHKKGRQTAIRRIVAIVRGESSAAEDSPRTNRTERTGRPGRADRKIRKERSVPMPVVLYESPHRIVKLLEELAAAGIEKIGVARELTKMHEEFLQGAPRDVARDLEGRKAVRGEFVVIIES